MEDKMLIGIAITGDSLDSPVDPRFGRANAFAIVETDSDELKSVIKNPNVSSGGGAGISTAQLLANEGIKAIIAGAIGPNAFGVLKSAKIDIYSSSGVSSAREALEKFKAGKLTKSTNATTMPHNRRI